MRQSAFGFLAAGLLSLPVAAVAQDCVGRNLIADLPATTLAALNEAVTSVPNHQGVLWQATKGKQRLTIVGTYHFQDPRHDATMQRLEPALNDAAMLMVEAGPEEEARLAEALAKDPTLTVETNGPTLPERLTSDDWQILSQAMAERGTPAAFTARLKPWYVSLLMGISPCMMRSIARDGAVEGLDRMLMDRAGDMDLPVRALEPWDTVFSLFGDLTAEQEIDMIRASLPAAQYADDYAVTLTEAYFSGNVWSIWEFGRFDAYENSGLTRAAVDAQMQLAQTKLMDNRNASWIAPLEDAAAEAAGQGKGIVVGFGALHLPGERGVLNLLEQRGWTIERLDR